MREDVLPLFASIIAPDDKQLLDTVINKGLAISAPLSKATPDTIANIVPETGVAPLKSADYNNFFQSIYRDLVRLYAAALDNDQRIHTLERLGADELASVAQQLDRIEDQIRAAADLQLGFNSGYTAYQRVNFIESQAIEHDPAVLGGVFNIVYDPRQQAVTLAASKTRDVLHNNIGELLVSVGLDNQFGYPIKAYSNLRTPDHALDRSEKSFWGEVVLTEEPISVPWPGTTSVYLPAASAGNISYIKTGAIAEYTINFHQPANFNTITIKPFCDLPINLAAIFVIKRDQNKPAPIGQVKFQQTSIGFSRYLITEYSSARLNGQLFINETQHLSFPLQEDVSSITLIFHQSHYTKQVFQLPAQQNQQHVLWQQMLGNTPLLGVPDVPSAALAPGVGLTFNNDPSEVIAQTANALGSQLQGPLLSPKDKKESFTRYQYIYGAYSLEVTDRRYVKTGTLISKPLKTTINLAQGALVSNDDLPFTSCTIAAASAWAGDPMWIPTSWTAPSATLTYDLTFGEGQQWLPAAPLNATMIHEPLILNPGDPSALQLNLRLQAKTATPVYITSFDGVGGSSLLGGYTVPAASAANINLPTTINLGSVALNSPGFYVLSYTPSVAAQSVDFANFTGPQSPDILKTWVAVPSRADQPLLADKLRGLALIETPYVDSSKIGTGFEPNGNSSKEYVPISVHIDNLPFTFLDPANPGSTLSISSFTQDTAHLTDIFASIPIQLETLYSTDANPQAATTFQAKFSNWDTRPGHYPQLFKLQTSGPAVAIPQVGSTGIANWQFDPATGIVRFVNGQGGVSGQTALSYWYYGPRYAGPFIVNRTDYIAGNHPALKPFDPINYPVIEYLHIGDRLYFNLNIPTTALVKVTYHRLFDEIRARAIMTRVDPVNESATPHLYGFTILGRDANGTSDYFSEQQEVVWADIEVLALGRLTQVNPQRNLVNLPSLQLSPASTVTAPASASVPALVDFSWYKLTNAGSSPDYLCFTYDGGQGTAVYWDLNGTQFIEPDNGATQNINYVTMNNDASNSIPINPGQSVIVGLVNLKNASSPTNFIQPVTVFSIYPSNYLQSQVWQFQGTPSTKELSAAQFTLT